MRRVVLTVIVGSLALATAMWTGCSKKSSESADTTSSSTPPRKLVSTPAPRANPPARAPEVPALDVAVAPQPATATAPAQPEVVASTQPADWPDDTFPSPQQAAARRQYGITIIDIVAHQYTIDVQFMVMEPEKAGPILSSPSSQRYLIDEKSGTKMLPPPVGGPRSRRDLSLRPKVGSPMGTRAYYATFDNSAGTVKPGDKVSLTIDQCHIDGLVVQSQP